LCISRVSCRIQVVGDADAARGVSLGLRTDEACVQRVGKGRGEDEASRFDAYNQVYGYVGVVLRRHPDGAESGGSRRRVVMS